MKKLQAIKDNGREYGKYAQVKNNFVYLTNGSMLLKIPAEEVFGKDIIQPEDVLYFDLKMWALFKFHSAKQIWREGNTFKTNQGLAYMPMDEKTFSGICKYPDVDIVIPDRTKPVNAISKYGLHATEYFNLITAWGIDQNFVRMWFYGEDKGCILESTESKGFAYLMPLNPTHDKWDRFESFPEAVLETADDLL